MIYILLIVKIFKNKKSFLFSGLLTLIICPIIYGGLGDFKALEYLSLPKIQSQLLEYKKIRPLIAQVERKSAKMGMLCDIEPKNIDNWWQYGQLLEIQQREDDALIIYAKANVIHSESIPILERLILLNLKADKGIASKKTIDYYNDLIKIAPKNIIAIHAKALLLYQEGNFNSAASLWEEVLLNIDASAPYINVKQNIKEMIALAKAYGLEPKIKLALNLSGDSLTLTHKHLFVALKKKGRNGPPILAHKIAMEHLPNVLQLGLQHAIDYQNGWASITPSDAFILEVHLSESDILDSSTKLLLTKHLTYQVLQGTPSYVVDI
ncbi:MAG: hypothetical protein HOL58_00775 [Francisellaceae bacterium]|nr:hypothetical protein [Francisellaceae bacterium]